jgi:lipopolysaccharide core galacturonosyltransferase RgtA
LLERIRTRSASCLLVISLWLLTYIVARLSLPHAMELDEAEQVFFSQWLRLGYGPQPPLYNWLQQCVFSLLGASLLSIVLLKSALLFACFFFMLSAARRVSSRQDHQTAALIGLLLLPQVAYMPLQDLTHTVLLLAATSFFYESLLAVVHRPSGPRYAFLGLACAIGFLAKYNFAMIPFAAILAALPDRKLRARVFDFRIAISVTVGIVLVGPHLAWLATHFGTATEGTLAKMSALSQNGSHLSRASTGLYSFAEAAVAFAALLLIVFTYSYRGHLRHIVGAQTRTTLFLGRILLILTLALVAVILATGAGNIKERWLDPFYLLLPLYLVAKIKAAQIDDVNASRRFTAIGLVIPPLSIMILTLRVVAAPLIGDYTKVNIPFAGLAAALRHDGVVPAAVLSPNWHYAGNLKTQFNDVPSLSADQVEFTLPVFVSAERPLLAVWPAAKGGGAGLPTSMQDWLTGTAQLSLVREGKFSLPYVYGTDEELYTFDYALFAPPAKQPSSTATSILEMTPANRR